MNDPTDLAFYFSEEEKKHQIGYGALSSFYETPKSSPFQTTKPVARLILVKEEIVDKTITTFFKDFKIFVKRAEKKIDNEN